MIIFLVFVMQSAAQLLFAQNLTIEVCDIEKVEGHLYVAIYNSEETFMYYPAIRRGRADCRHTDGGCHPHSSGSIQTGGSH